MMFSGRSCLSRLRSKSGLRSRVAGVALLEVMIALGVVAVAATALLLRMQSIANSAIFIEERTVAYWIAENRMQEILADHALQKNIQRTRGDKDVLEYDGREWYWSSSLEEVLMPDILAPAKMYRLDVAVGLEPDKPLATLSGFARE